MAISPPEIDEQKSISFPVLYQQCIPKARSTGSFSNSVQEFDVPHIRWLPDVHDWFTYILHGHSSPKKDPSKLVPWSFQVPARESCYLVELLDKGWHERNVLASRGQRKLPRVTVETSNLEPSFDLLRVSSERLGLDRGRGSKPSGSSSKRSSSVDSVRHLDLKSNSSAGRQLVNPKCTSTSGVSTTLSELPRISKTQRKKNALKDSDLDELQGFIDLGFYFPQNSTSPRMAAALPALRLYHAVESVQHRLTSNGKLPRGRPAGSIHSWRSREHLKPLLENLDESPNSQRESPAGRLPEAWVLPEGSHIEDPDVIKAHLRLWARTVATTVRQAC